MGYFSNIYNLNVVYFRSAYSCLDACGDDSSQLTSSISSDDIKQLVRSGVLSLVPAVTADSTEICKLVNLCYRGELSRKGWTTEAEVLEGSKVLNCVAQIVVLN